MRDCAHILTTTCFRDTIPMLSGGQSSLVRSALRSACKVDLAANPAKVDVCNHAPIQPNLS